MCFVSVATGRSVGPRAVQHLERMLALIWRLILYNLIKFNKAE